MYDPVLVKSKLLRLSRYTAELEAEQHRTEEEFLADTVFQRFVERSIQLAAEEMAGICRHLVSSLNLGEPETYGQCFDFLEKAKIVTGEEAKIYRSILGFRNLLVHMYSNIDSKRTYQFFMNGISDFRKFNTSLEHWMEHHPGS